LDLPAYRDAAVHLAACIQEPRTIRSNDGDDSLTMLFGVADSYPKLKAIATFVGP
jgi:hypothetical protein